jgi:trans-2,3-dihydro-3-hydroxyanthranilate isomerase
MITNPIEILYYLVTVFTSQKHGGNQLAVFIDLEDKVSTKKMLSIAKGLQLPEITFVKKNHDNKQFEVRIFTPEYEVPFAGHPSLGTAFVISKHIVSSPPEKMVLNLKHSNICIDTTSISDIDNSIFTMEQAEPEFIATYSPQEIADELSISTEVLDLEQPIEEISTGLPYMIIPIINLESMNQLQLDARKVLEFLIKKKKYKTNSTSGLTTALFFVTKETFEKPNSFNTRMFCIENGNLVEDAATGSANGCFLAYLLKNKSSQIAAIVEQGFQMGRKSYIQLKGQLKNNTYSIKIGGQVVDLGRAKWHG